MAVLTGSIVVVAVMVSIVSFALAGPSSFPDVYTTNPYYAAITALASQDIVSGFANGYFGPGDPVSRQQFAKMVVLAGEYPVSEANVCPFTDVVVSGPGTLYPDNYVAVCAAKGITVGKTATHFDPYANITRYQAVSMLVRAALDLKPALLAAPPSTGTAPAPGRTTPLTVRTPHWPSTTGSSPGSISAPSIRAPTSPGARSPRSSTT